MSGVAVCSLVLSLAILNCDANIGVKAAKEINGHSVFVGKQVLFSVSQT